jgi:DNA-binding CsgD family transcriptional regulator
MEPAEAQILEDIVQRRAAGVDLTPCEREQLYLIARGAMARSVAESAGISYEAVRCRRSRLFRALGVSGSSELVSQLLGLSLQRLTDRGSLGDRAAA